MLDVASVVSSQIVEALGSASFLSFTGHAAIPAHGFIAVSPAMKRVRELVNSAAASDLPVVIVGEANTGKEFIARLVHTNSDRASDNLVAVDASFDSQNAEAAISTGARRGTLFVAEIAATSLSLQLKVLRACAHPGGAANVRLVATASLDRNRRRKDDVQVATSFRRELYRQHGALIIEVPSLRERRADIVPLARHFLAQARPDSKMTMDAEVERDLEAYDWPENLAELQSVMTQAALLTQGTVVTVAALRGLLRPSPRALAADMAAMPYHEMLETARSRLAREYFAILLQETGGNVTHAAARAGVGRESLHRILKQLGLAASDFRRK